MTQSLYSLEQADKALPYVRVIVDEIRECYAELRDLSAKHNRLKKDGDQAPELEALRVEIKGRAGRIRECEEELMAIGAELKDYELGLVDFPSELDGRAILLCWKRDEERIEFWHEIESGFSGRREVPEGDRAWPLGVSAVRGA